MSDPTLDAITKAMDVGVWDLVRGLQLPSGLTVGDPSEAIKPNLIQAPVQNVFAGETIVALQKVIIDLRRERIALIVNLNSAYDEIDRLKAAAAKPKHDPWPRKFYEGLNK